MHPGWGDRSPPTRESTKGQPIRLLHRVVSGRLEPPTSSFAGKRSNPLSYETIRSFHRQVWLSCSRPSPVTGRSPADVAETGCNLSGRIGAASGVRSHNLMLKRQLLYPFELSLRMKGLTGLIRPSPGGAHPLLPTHGRWGTPPRNRTSNLWFWRPTLCLVELAVHDDGRLKAAE
jgi:hypothetical protein